MNKQSKILCVDDDRRILNTLERLLTLEGYKVFAATDAIKALELLEKEHVDLILTDQRMPKMTGAEFLRIAREKYPNTIRIMLSGYSDFEGLAKAVNEGEIFRFFSKPWNIDDLLLTVKKALEQNEILGVVSSLIDSLCQIANLSDNIKLNSSQDHSTIVLCIDKKNGINEDKITDFVNLIVASLNSEEKEKLKVSSGHISREKGSLVITLNIGKNLTLRVELKDSSS